MIEDNTYTATIDRIEESIAVVLIEADGAVIEERHIHNLERIPEAGRHGGAVLRVSIVDGEIATIEYDAESEQSRRERVQERFDNLSERPPGRDSDR